MNLGRRRPTLFLDRPPRHPARPRRAPRDEHPKPAYALALLFVAYFALGTVIANWQAALAIGLVTGIVGWLLAVVLEAFGVPDSWRLHRTRRQVRRDLRGGRVVTGG